MKNIQMVPLTPEQKTKRDDAGAKATTTSSAAAPESARSLKQSTVTVPLRRSQKVAVAKPSNQSPTTVDGSTKKIADEIPQVISLNDL